MKKFIIISIILVSIFSLYANSTINSNVIALNGEAQITFTFSPIPDNVEVLQIPNVKNLNIQGPFKSTEIQIVNFSKKESLKVYFILHAQKTGSYVIPAIRLKVDGKEVSGNTHHLRVVESKNSGKSSGVFNPFNDPVWNNFFGGKNFFSKRHYETKGLALAKLSFTKRNPYIGEIFGAYYVIAFKNFSEAQINSSKSKFPKWDGFYSKNFESNNDIKTAPMLVPDYNNAIFTRKTFLVALKTGEIQIEPHYIYLQDLNDYASPVKAYIKSNAVYVKPLPIKDKPGDFSGNVGDFNISMKNIEKSFKQYKPFTIIITVDGKGNFIHFTEPEFRANAGFNLVDKRIIEKKMNDSLSTFSGKIIIEYTINSNVSGNYSPGYFYSTSFNPYNKKYKINNMEIPLFNFAKGKYTESKSFKKAAKRKENLEYIKLIIIVLFIGIVLILLRSKSGKKITMLLIKPLNKKLNTEKEKNDRIQLLKKLIGEKRGILLEHYLLEKGLSEKEVAVFQNIVNKIYMDKSWKKNLKFTEYEDSLIEKVLAGAR